MAAILADAEDTGHRNRAALLAEATSVREAVYPSAVWAVGDAEGIRTSGAVGLLDPDRPDEPMRLDTVIDVASLTKILTVWSTMGTLVEEGKLELHTPLGTFWTGPPATPWPTSAPLPPAPHRGPAPGPPT
ncbi:serine hydrolase [Streptomyces sp. NBC_01310]|uniref:serine hydrolase n=1 Tax=Streptomyces sp. NBC_01310 TaxID=2903820 RepID=UPI0035B650AC